MTHRVLYVDSWRDERVAELANDCMLSVGQGVHFHHRLQLLIVVKSGLPGPVAAHLPTG